MDPGNRPAGRPGTARSGIPWLPAVLIVLALGVIWLIGTPGGEPQQQADDAAPVTSLPDPVEAGSVLPSQQPTVPTEIFRVVHEGPGMIVTVHPLAGPADAPRPELAGDAPRRLVIVSQPGQLPQEGRLRVIAEVPAGEP